MSALVPVARTPISIRPAVAGDYAFIDRLQDMHSKALGFMPKAQLEGKIKLGHVLIAEEMNVDCGSLNVGEEVAASALPFQQSTVNTQQSMPIGYVMSQDRYFKRDDVGIVYQMNVSPTAQRKLVGAMLLQEVFHRAAYGCKLFCCWCAQDLDANYFWESLGFIPLAFRTGASGKRTHIFWQRRIREGDTTTPYWFPSKTDGGMMREDRLVLPIPPGVHWKDAMPILLPQVPAEPKALPEQKRSSTPAVGKRPKPPIAPVPQSGLGKLWFPSGAQPAGEKPKRAKKEKVKADPAHIERARELRDRYLEQFNGGTLRLPEAKYDISRQLAAPAVMVEEPRQLPHAA